MAGDRGTRRDDAAVSAAVRTPPLDRAFYARDAETVARDLLGKVICHQVEGVTRSARLVEVEAYVGVHDLASHSSHGRTARTAVMFGPPGHAYVYFIYGMHYMLNVVAGGEGDPQAVLLRAAEPLAGLAGCLGGPALLTRALGVTLAQNAVDLVDSALTIRAGQPPERVVVTARVGVDYAAEWASAPLRFLDGDSPCVSRGRAARPTQAPRSGARPRARSRPAPSSTRE